MMMVLVRVSELYKSIGTVRKLELITNTSTSTSKSSKRQTPALFLCTYSSDYSTVRRMVPPGTAAPGGEGGGRPNLESYILGK